jgi:ADP-heptose:LPS heptosyltransferase
LTRPDHLGDVLLTLPGVAALRRTLRKAHVTYLVSPRAAEVPRHCPHVDETLVVSFPEPNAATDPPGWSPVAARQADALRGRFDVAIVLRPDDPWSAGLVEAAAIPIRVGFDQPRTLPHLTHVVPDPHEGHVVGLAERLVAVAVAALGTSEPLEPASSTETWFSVSEEDDAEALAVVAGARVAEPLVLLHPGSAWRLKNWPRSRWAALASGLAATLGVRPLVVGGGHEKGLVGSIVSASRGAACGVTHVSLGGLAALQRRAGVVIATDSGPMHLAALVGAPVLGLFGPGDPAMFGPVGPGAHSRVIRVELPCSPCRALERPPCGATIEPACVMGIGVDAVIASAAELFASSLE